MNEIELQPDITDIKIVDGLFIRSNTFNHKNSMAPQHVHTWDHISVIASGGVRIWADEKLLGDFFAPTGVVINKGIFHKFLTLEDNTTILCIHRTEEVNIERITDQDVK